MKACGVEETNKGLVTIYKTYSQSIHYIIVSRSMNRMNFVMALTRTVQ